MIAEYAMGKRSRTGTIGTFRIFAGKKFAWMGLWTAWISSAIGFYYAVVSGWTIKYFQLGITGALNGEGVDTTEVWNAFLQDSGQVVFYQALVIVLTLAAILKGAKAIEKVNVVLMVSLFCLLFLTLFLFKILSIFYYFVSLNEITKRYKLIKNIIELKGKIINTIASFNSIM